MRTFIQLQIEKNDGVLAERRATSANPPTEVWQRQLGATFQLQRGAAHQARGATSSGGRQGHRGAAPGPSGKAVIARYASLLHAIYLLINML